MKLYEASYSWEVDPEGSSYAIFHTSLRDAIDTAVRLCREQMAEYIENCDYGDTSSVPSLEVTIESVLVGKITKRMFCGVLNSNGGRWMVSNSQQHLATITMAVADKQPKVVRNPQAVKA